MRMLSGTANAMMRSILTSLVATPISTNLTGHCFSLLLFKGAMPTKQQMNDYCNGPTQWASNTTYTNITSLLSARNADYVGGVVGAKPNMSLTADNVAVLSAQAMNTRLFATANDTRNCYLTNATPTWFLLVASGNRSMNIGTGLEVGTSLDVCVFAGSVGDENSTADLKIMGGKIYANTPSGDDQSKALIISDLILKLS